MRAELDELATLRAAASIFDRILRLRRLALSYRRQSPQDRKRQVTERPGNQSHRTGIEYT